MFTFIRLFWPIFFGFIIVGGMRAGHGPGGFFPSPIGQLTPEAEEVLKIIKEKKTEAGGSSSKADEHHEKKTDLENKVLELNDELEKLEVSGKNADDYALIAMAKLAEKGAEIASKAHWVARLAVLALGQLIKKPDSPELKGLKKLNEVMVRKFAHLSRVIEDTILRVACDSALTLYNLEVKIRVNHLMQSFNTLFNLSSVKNEESLKLTRHNFSRVCNGPDGPTAGNIYAALNFIQWHVLGSCQPEHDYHPGELDSQQICKSNPDEPDIQKLCTLKQVTEGNQDRRGPLLNFAMVVTQHLIHLELAWPATVGTRAVEVIGDGDVKAKDQNELDKIAEQIAEGAVERGPLNAGYQVFFWRHSDSDDTMRGWQNRLARCESDHKCKWVHRNNLHVYIVQFRLDDAQVERVERARAWMDNHREHIRQLMTKSPQQTKATFEKDLPGIVDRIVGESAGLHDHFRTHILMVRCQQFAIRELQNHYGWAQKMSASAKTENIADKLKDHKFGLVHSGGNGEWRDFVVIP